MGEIGGTALSQYGLQLIKMDGELDLPKFKDILEEHDFSADLQVLDEKVVSITLFGKYRSRAELGSAVSGLMDKVRSKVRQQWKFPSLQFDETCVVRHGVKTVLHGGRAVEVLINLTITKE